MYSDISLNSNNNKGRKKKSKGGEGTTEPHHPIVKEDMPRSGSRIVYKVGMDYQSDQGSLRMHLNLCLLCADFSLSKPGKTPPDLVCLQVVPGDARPQHRLGIGERVPIGVR